MQIAISKKVRIFLIVLFFVALLSIAVLAIHPALPARPASTASATSPDAQAAINAATAFYTLNYTVGIDLWVTRVCATATDAGCQAIQGYFAPAVQEMMKKHQIQTACTVEPVRLVADSNQTRIWQGVTYFLTPEGIDGTLAFIAEHSGLDSTVIFDYIYNEILHDTTQGYGKTLARAGKMSGELYVFGIDKGQVGHFLAQRGFCDVIDMPLENLKSNYFTGPNAGRAIDTGHIAIASAKVCRAKS